LKLEHWAAVRLSKGGRRTRVGEVSSDTPRPSAIVLDTLPDVRARQRQRFEDHGVDALKIAVVAPTIASVSSATIVKAGWDTKCRKANVTSWTNSERYSVRRMSLSFVCPDRGTPD
jgi:hypothetical protein